MRGSVPAGTRSTTGCYAEAGAEPLAHQGAQGVEAVAVARGVLRAHQQLVHRLAARHDDAELAPEAVDGTQGVLDGARIDVLAPHDDHVVEAAVEAPGQARVRPAAGAGLVHPPRAIARHQPDHGLGGPLEVSVHGRALGAVGQGRKVSGSHTWV